MLQSAQARQSLYEVLGCSSEASADELRKAYHKAALRWHPDKHVHAEPAQQIEADARFKELAAAWAVLGDEGLRSDYDADQQRAAA